MKSEMPFVPSGASGNRASTRWMMFSAMSCSPNVMKIFVPDNQVMVARRHGTRAHLREIRAGLRLGQAHRARPLAGDEVGNEALLLFERADELDRLDRALIEQRAVGKADVGRVPHLERRPEQELRQPLPAVLGRYGQADPAGLGELLVRFLEPGRRRDVRRRSSVQPSVSPTRLSGSSTPVAKAAASSSTESSTSSTSSHPGSAAIASTSASSRSANCMSRSGAR